VGEQCVIIQVGQHAWEVPGGTLEPNEHYLDTARRELFEEVGVDLIDFHPFGAWHCHSLADKPYRAHLPHPHFYRLVGYGEVEKVSAPLNPPGGEQVTLVEVVSIDEAARRFHSIGRDDLAELYQLAELVRAKENHANL
jgi:8-oxo-dGTP pyrophosphatase MutT (NUDIX family)